MQHTRIIIFTLITVLLPTSAAARSFDNYFQYIYNRYSQHFDQNGLVYAVPDYGIKKMSIPTTSREIISLASYYKFRALNDETEAKNIIKKNIIKSLEIIEKQKYLSFNDGESLFLSHSISQQIPNLLTLEETVRLNQTILNALENGLLAKDTENRAFISATHFQILSNELFKKGLLEESRKKYLDQLADQKIETATKKSISSQGWYKENGTIIPHYQAVSAFMLLTYADIMKKKQYHEIAKKLYFNLKKISFSNGLIEAKIGYRPTGLGAQFYLMMAIMSENFADQEKPIFWSYLNQSDFFRDKRFPNRLEYHCTSCSKPSNFHDDYAFSDIAELSYHLSSPSSTPNLNLSPTPAAKEYDDGEVKIKYKKNGIVLIDQPKKYYITVDQIAEDKTRIKKIYLKQPIR